jgi:hypothetical protein
MVVTDDDLRFRRWPHSPSKLISMPGSRVEQVVRYIPGEFKYENDVAFDLASDANHQCVHRILRRLTRNVSVWLLTSHHRCRKAHDVWVFEIAWCPCKGHKSRAIP